jgi:hypothetical protein
LENQPINRRHESLLANFEGIYLGFSPSLGSSIGLGEVSINIDDRQVTILKATGHGIEQEIINKSSIQILEIDNDTEPSRHSQQRFIVGNYVFVFNTAPVKNDDPILIVMQPVNNELCGPNNATVLFNQLQIENGTYNQLGIFIESEYGMLGDMPKLANGGFANNG